MVSVHQHNKRQIALLGQALYDSDPARLRDQLRAAFAPGAAVHLAHPFEDLDGADELYEQAYRPLLAAVPDLERRDYILIAGETDGMQWVGCAGHYMGVFEHPWLDIPPTKHAVAMRYHEFFRMEEGRIVEMQALWDIPQVMMQANAWPLSPSLGVEWLAPAPAPQDGLRLGEDAPEEAAASLKLVSDMLTGLHNSPQGVEAMQLERYWHPRMMWYGPAGIGAMRRISGFRNWHQIPFLSALPDRRTAISGASGFFGDGPYVGYTAWPGMKMTVTGDGWLGIAPGNQSITMRSLDFWRREGGMLRENWVLIDLLHVYHQLGVDVLRRMREVTFARQPNPQYQK